MPSLSWFSFLADHAIFFTRTLLFYASISYRKLFTIVCKQCDLHGFVSLLMPVTVAVCQSIYKIFVANIPLEVLRFVESICFRFFHHNPLETSIRNLQMNVLPFGESSWYKSDLPYYLQIFLLSREEDITRMEERIWLYRDIGRLFQMHHEFAESWDIKLFLIIPITRLHGSSG